VPKQRSPRTKGRRCAPEPRCCSSVSATLSSVREIVAAYIGCYRPRAERERSFYGQQRTLADAISTAALARTAENKRHSHQCRIPGRSLEEARKSLLAINFQSSLTFDEFHSVVEKATGHIHMIGELAVYDTALRIGAFLGTEPERVYLHRGTRDGARALGLGRGRKSLEVDELPAEFRRLRPYEVEDCLCIYKSDLARLAR
jgi:hypothetical protein